MYVSSIFLDRFGRRANLRLANLVNGLNVIYGPQGSGKTTLIDFLRAMWSGFDSRLREQYLPPESRGFGGAISVQTAHGRQTISRYDDGGPEGRLTVEREDGAVIGRRHLHDLTGDVSATLLERAFLVDFQRRPRLEELLVAATARGYELGERPESSASFLAVDSLLAEKREQLRRLELAKHPDSGATNSEHDLNERERHQLRTLDAQLARWKRTLRDVVVRQQRVAERSDNRQLEAAAVAAANAAPRRRLRALETRIQALQQSLGPLSAPDRDCVCQALRATLADSLHAMRDEVYQLCNDLNHWQSHHQHRKAVGERDQLARCEWELRQAIQSLTDRRQALMQRIVTANSATCCHPDHMPRCQCADHPRAATPTDTTIASDVGPDQSVRDAELRRDLLREISQLEEEWRRLRDPPGSISLVRAASQYLRRLSSDEWSEIDVTSPQVVRVAGAHGRRLRYDDLDSGTRDQVYLAFCLAVVSACDRDGIQIPLVLNAPFTRYPSKQVGEALELLSEVGRDRQVLCLTRLEHVVGLARMLNVPVHSLASTEGVDSRPREFGEVERPAPSAPSSELRPFSVQSKNRSHLSARREVHGSEWDAEEFPGELADRVRHPEARASKPVVTEDSPRVAPSIPAAPQTVPVVAVEQPVTEYYLSETDPIERAPSVDETHANRLRKIGILRVTDLLHTPAAKCAADLTVWGITREMVQSWQSQARLMCQVRRLRPYDARILVACGIAGPEQLSEMSSAALRARVKELAATAKGQAILLSGTESELSRVMEWVQTAREESPRNWPRTEGAKRSSHTEHSQSPKPAKRRKITRESSLGVSAHDDRAASRDNRRALDVSDRASLPVGKNGLRFLLQRSNGVTDAPSIGPSMAKRLEKFGIGSVADLLNASAEVIAARLQMNRVTAATVRQWQQQAELVCRVPQLSGQDARILVSVGVCNIDELAAMDPHELWLRVQPFCATLDGKRLLRNGNEPSAAEVAGWVHRARHVRALHAA